MTILLENLIFNSCPFPADIRKMSRNIFKKYVLTSLLVIVLSTALLYGRVSVPFDPSRGLVEVEVTIDGRINGRFGIDTGADHLYVDKTFADKNRLVYYDEMDNRQIVGVAGRATGNYASLRSLAIGDERLYNLRAIVTDLATLAGPSAGAPPDGLIGFDVIRRFYVTVDYPNNRLELNQGEPALIRDHDYISIPFRESGHLILVKVTFDDDISAVMLLDFCASYSTVSNHLAGRLGLRQHTRDIQTLSEISLGSGVTGRDVRVIAMDVAQGPGNDHGAYEGIIGASLLYRYKITIDYKRHRVLIHN
ncbi:MAG: aspartyl protease family protein [Candidatus Zixiibacteriota bacterium]